MLMVAACQATESTQVAVAPLDLVTATAPAATVSAESSATVPPSAPPEPTETPNPTATSEPTATAQATNTPMPPTSTPSSTPNSARTIFDFNDGADAANWQLVNDTVMGGVSTSGGRIDAGTLLFVGELSLANNGGFTSVRRTMVQDLSDYEGLRMRVRGDGRSYYLRLLDVNSEDNVAVEHEIAFETEADTWTIVALPFESFYPNFRGRRIDRPPLEPENIRGISIMLREKVEGPFQLEIDYFEAYK